ncbi:MFS transporter [Chloroflexi bacterium TSY]|nr:MFS transporter [Chloroflexi bacterium TSY]
MITHSRAIRWLLQLDRPVPERTEEELTAEMYANYRWNFTANLLDASFFWLGMSFVSAATIMPLFVSKVTSNTFVIALVAIIGQSSWYLPQLFTASAIERVARKKPFVANLGLLAERLPLWILPVAAMFALSNPTIALVVFFMAYAWHGLGAGAIAPAWSEMLARCFPVNRRGRFFGLASFIGTGTGALGALFSGWLLDTYPFPTNFVYVFLLAAVIVVFSWFFLAMVREPVKRVSPEILASRGRSYQKILHILQGDTNFRHFLLALLLKNLSWMGLGFLTVAAIFNWQIADGMAAQFGAVMLVGQTVGNLLVGLLADRYGHKQSLEIGAGATAIAFLLAWAAPVAAWYYAVFFLLGVGEGIGIVSGVLIPLEFTHPEHRPTYVGLANTTSGVGKVLAPAIGGLLAFYSYEWLFALSGIIGILALLMLRFIVQEPRKQSELFEANVAGAAL